MKQQAFFILFKIGKQRPSTGRCELFDQEESLEHVMLYCPKYDAERGELILNLKS